MILIQEGAISTFRVFASWKEKEKTCSAIGSELKVLEKIPFDYPRDKAIWKTMLYQANKYYIINFLCSLVEKLNWKLLEVWLFFLLIGWNMALKSGWNVAISSGQNLDVNVILLSSYHNIGLDGLVFLSRMSRILYTHNPAKK